MKEAKSASMREGAVSSSDLKAVEAALRQVREKRNVLLPSSGGIDPRFRSPRYSTPLRYAQRLHALREMEKKIASTNGIKLTVELLAELLDRGFTPNSLQIALDEGRSLVESLYEAHPHRPPKKKYVMQFKKVILAKPPLESPNEKIQT